MDQCGGGALLLDTDGRTRVDATGLDALAVLRKPDHAVSVRALQIGFGHEVCHRARIVSGQAHRLQGGGHVMFELSNLNG